MSKVKHFKIPAPKVTELHAMSSTIGKIVDVTEQGIAIVDFPENTGQPIMARSTLGDIEKSQLTDFPAPVLLVFEQSDPLKPIITGFINKVLFTEQPTVIKSSPEKAQKTEEAGNSDKVTDATIDGRKITFDAKQEILLRCGKSSILLRRDGKIVIKGSNLVSRSSATNKIKGSSVSIN